MKKLSVAMLMMAVVGCSSIATFFTPQKKVAEKETEMAKQANRYFWDNYHQGNYENIPAIIERLTWLCRRTRTTYGLLRTWDLCMFGRFRTAKAGVCEPCYHRAYQFVKKYFEKHTP